MAISNVEFVRRVRAGDGVSGEHVSGSVKLDGSIAQANWSNCTFDSTVELKDCSIAIESSTPDAKALDLGGCRFAGDLSLRDIKVNVDLKQPATGGYRPANVGSATPAERTVAISLADATIVGNLDIAGFALASMQAAGNDIHPRLALRAPRAKIAGEVSIHTHGVDAIPQALNPWLSLIGFERGVVERSFRLEGGFRRLDCTSAQVNADMHLVLLPAGDDANQVVLHSARVGGDLLVEPQFEYCEERRNRGYEEARERGLEQLPDILAAIEGERLRVGGDASVGVSVFADDDSFEPIALTRMNLRRAAIGNQLAIHGVEVAGWLLLEFGGHHRVGLCLNQVEAGNCIVRKVHAAVASPPAGDFGTLLDMREMQVRSDIAVQGISGAIATAGAGGQVLGVDLSSVTCRNLTISKFEVTDSDRPDANVLEIYGERLQVAGDASLSVTSEKEQAPLVRLPDGVISRLVLDRPVPEGKVELMGTAIERWNMGGTSEGGNNETAENYLAMLRCSPVLDVGQYVSIEQRLETLGHRNDADLVRRSMKRRQRREHYFGDGTGKRRLWPRHGMRWFVSLMHDVSLGYGTQVWRPAVLLVALFAVSVWLSGRHYQDWYQVSAAKLAELAECGTACDARTGDYALAEKDARGAILRDAAGLSARNLVPIIDVGMSAHLEPVRGRGGEAWLQFLRIMGWITWPVLLTGLLARLMPKRSQ